MADLIRFKKIFPEYSESEYFRFTSDELIEFFKAHPVIDENVFKKIESHEPVSVSYDEDTRYKYHFNPYEDSDDYILFMTKPINETPIIYDKLLEYLQKKEPVNFNEKNETQWKETWRLKP